MVASVTTPATGASESRPFSPSQSWEQCVKSEVETLSPTRVKLSVEVPFEELKPNMDTAYRTIGQQISVPGFRKGKVPARIIDSRVGRGAVLQEAINDAEAKVKPMAQPEVEITDIPDPSEGGDLKFVAEIDVQPEVTLPEYSSLEVQLEPIVVTDDDVQERLDDLRERFATLVGVDRPAVDGDFVSIDLEAAVDGEHVDSASGLSYQIGSKTMLDGMDEALIGLSAGEQTVFASTLMGGTHEGRTADVTVSVASVKERLLPDADDEFAELASEFDTIEELRVSLREQAEQQRRFQAGIEARDKVLEALVAACEVPVPEKVVEAEVNAHLEGEDRVADDDHRSEITEEVTKALRVQLVLDAVAEAENVSVGQNELVEYLVQQSRMYGLAPQEFMERVQQANQLPTMLAEIARRKGLSVVLENATIRDADGEIVNLDELLPRPVAAPHDEDDHDHEGHDHDHEGHDHDHEGHDHDHEGHDHDHEGHDHDHEGHDREDEDGAGDGHGADSERESHPDAHGGATHGEAGPVGEASESGESRPGE
jgi:trigger factor